ncbi:MAG: hypothetical protein Q9223_002416 [Gallowayella weberi]
MVKRGNNTETTFGHGGKGKWTFHDHPNKVRKVICDPALQTKRPLSRRNPPTTEKAVSNGPFETVEVMVGALVQKPDYRCQVLDKGGKSIIVTRNTNRDITFSDADRGEWKFARASQIGKVIRDPAFKAGSA